MTKKLVQTISYTMIKDINNSSNIHWILTTLLKISVKWDDKDLLLFIKNSSNKMEYN